MKFIKIPKKSLIILGITSIFLLTTSVLIFKNYSFQQKRIIDPSYSNGVTLPHGKQTYYIQGSHNSPQFMEAIIDPVDVRVGDNQTMTIKIRDEYSITKVEAQVETDTGIKIYKLDLVEGIDTDGIWQGSWTVHDTHSEKYRTTFFAIDSNNEPSIITLTWSDPCSVPAGGDWTLDGNCSFSGTNGADNGNLTINTSYALTIQADSVFVWNSGKSINLSGGGSIAINATGQLKQTNLWMTDADSDGYPATITQYGQNDAPTNGKRRYLMNTVSSVDLDDTTACSDNSVSHDCGQDNGSGSCVAVSAGENELSACTRCNGVDLDHVSIATLNDSEGSNTCAGTCAGYCSSGNCINTDTSSGTCTIATNARVDSGGDGHCSSGTCSADTKANGEVCSSDGECTSTYCVDGYCCNSACSGSTCQTCGTLSSAGAGTCGYINSGSEDPDNECTATYNACDGNNRIGPDGYCSGTGYACKTTGLSSACATAGTCQTGGGCSVGSCVAVSNVAAYAEGTNCTAQCTGCNGAGSCIYIPNATADSWGSTYCNATHYRCNGSGGCTAPSYVSSCMINPYYNDGWTCTSACSIVSNVKGCLRAGGWVDDYNNCYNDTQACSFVGGRCTCEIYNY